MVAERRVSLFITRRNEQRNRTIKLCDASTPLRQRRFASFCVISRRFASARGRQASVCAEQALAGQVARRSGLRQELENILRIIRPPPQDAPPDDSVKAKLLERQIAASRAKFPQDLNIRTQAVIVFRA
ncbi:unnamed protein product, partial [Iphiclides podalirius]